ncbi:hypothetical protein [Piscinibacter sp.]|uniref:hypothetical protein n=1 Tax=Piscinibacter sp. TaxID=1903157 RepID=UPI002CE0D9BB|nr:hypothetical protein [Albitalea sp.]HUG24643.1 hypothetical protein [Albitalea sp.]
MHASSTAARPVQARPGHVERDLRQLERWQHAHQTSGRHFGLQDELEAEDGDVALVYRFSIVPGASATRSIRALLSWHHAEYTHFELVAE